MLYANFKDYNEFKEIFGLVKHNNGVTSRKNKLLLNFIKDSNVRKYCIANELALLKVKSMAELKTALMTRIKNSGFSDGGLEHKVSIMNTTYWSYKYSTDEYNGICLDGDCKSIRYYNHDNNGTYKMKAGKFIKAIIESCNFGKIIPNSIVNWLCEEFSLDWQVYSLGNIPENTLHVDNNFEDIYSSEKCLGNFGSCMVNKEQHYFYENAVSAKAAYLMNKEGLIISRCIVYTDVRDEEGNLWRLAERQYASDDNELLKRALVDSLVKVGEIDGYKRIGAGCGEANSFVDNNGFSLSDKTFFIDCNLDYDDTLSYQDSFKWYDIDKRVADNSGIGSIRLDITEDNLNENRSYDDFHDYYCDETTLVYFNGYEYYCDCNNLDDFIWIDSVEEYHHKDNVYKCPICGDYYIKKSAKHSDLTDKDYCCETCFAKDEYDYKKDNWHYSDFDDCYVETENELTYINQWDNSQKCYNKMTIKKETIKQIAGRLFQFCNVLYDCVDPMTNLPYGFILVKQEEAAYEYETA